MGKNQKVQNIKNNIHNLELELKIIQRECKHTNQTIKIIKPGEARWVCDDCEIKIKWPSPYELKEWL